MTYAYDAAYAPSLAAVKAAGGVAINGYLTGTYSSSTTQPAAARAAGLGFIATYEEGASELVGASRATGQAVGRRILAACQAKGVPLDGRVAVYPSVDVNAAPGSCDQGLLGIRDIIDGKLSLRCYAEGAIIDHLAAARITQGKGWLAAPTSWPGFRSDDPNVCMVQLVGTNVPGTDRNLITDPHALGAWWPDNSPYGADIVTPDEIAAVAAAVWQYGIKSSTGVVMPAKDRLLDIAGRATDNHNDLHALVVALPKPPTVAQIAAGVTTTPVDVNALAALLVAKLGTDLATQVARAIPANVVLAAK